MALDSRSKRASSVGILLFSILAPPAPDSGIDANDRQHIAVSYSGISADVPPPPPAATARRFSLVASQSNTVTLSASRSNTITLIASE